MSDDEIQTGNPGGVSNQPVPAPPPAAGPADDGNRFRRPDADRNRMALIAFWLAVSSLFLLVAAFAALSQWKPKDPPSNYTWRPDPFVETVMTLCIVLEIVLGPATLISGILGVRHSIRRATARGLGFSIFAILVGISISLLALCLIGLMTHPPGLPVMPMRRHGFWFGILLCGLILPARTASGADLAIFPADVPLTDPHAAQRLLVADEANGAVVADLTGKASFASADSAVATVDAAGVVRPAGDGETTAATRTSATWSP